MTDRITLGGIGYVFAGVTLLVAVLGAMVVTDYTSGRLSLESSVKVSAPR